MKPLLALVTLTLTALLFEENAREVANDAHDAVEQAVVQVREAKHSVARQVEQQPLISLLVAAAVAYALATIIPTRS